MCIGSSTPTASTPQTPQDVKQPDFAAMTKARKQNATMGGGTLLTGPSGISGTMNTGSTTLLGG